MKVFLALLMIWSITAIAPEVHSLEVTEMSEGILIEDEDLLEGALVVETEPEVEETTEVEEILEEEAFLGDAPPLLDTPPLDDTYLDVSIEEEDEEDKAVIGTIIPALGTVIDIVSFAHLEAVLTGGTYVVNSLSDDIANFGVTKAELEATLLYEDDTTEENEGTKRTFIETELAIDYEFIATSEALILNLPEILVLENSITGVMHQNIIFRGARTTITQGISGAHIAFSNAATIKIDNVQFNNIHAGTPASVASSFNGVIAPAANSSVYFENVGFQLGLGPGTGANFLAQNAFARIINAPQTDVTFRGNTVITTANLPDITLATTITAGNVRIEDDVTATITTNATTGGAANTGNNAFMSVTGFESASSATLSLTKGHNNVGTGSLIQMRTAGAARIGSLDVTQVGPIIMGTGATGQTTDVRIVAGSEWTVRTGNTITGTSTAAANVLRNFHIEDDATLSILRHPTTNANQPRFRVRNQFIIGDNVTFEGSRANSHTPATAPPTGSTHPGQFTSGQGADTHIESFITFTQASSRFEMGTESTLVVNQQGRLMQGVNGGTVAVIGERSIIRAHTGHGFTGPTLSHRLGSLTLADGAQLHLRQPTGGQFLGSTAAIRQASLRLNNNLSLGAGAKLTARRGQTGFTSRGNAREAALIDFNSANATVRLGPGSEMDLNQRGGFFRFANNTNARLILEEGASFTGATNTGLTIDDNDNFRRSFRFIEIGRSAEFNLTSERTAPYNANNAAITRSGSDLVRAHQITIADGGSFNVAGTVNKPTLVRLSGANSRINVNPGGTFNATGLGTAQAIVLIDSADAQVNVHSDATFIAHATGARTNVLRMSGARAQINVRDGGTFEATATANVENVVLFNGADTQLNVVNEGEFIASAPGAGGTAIIRFNGARARLNVNSDGLFRAIATGSANTTGGRDAVLRFQGANASVNIDGANYVDIAHHAAVSGTHFQRLFRSTNHGSGTGLRVNFDNQRIDVYTGPGNDRALRGTWSNLSGLLRINRNATPLGDIDSGLPSGSGGTGERRSRFMTVSSVSGTTLSRLPDELLFNRAINPGTTGVDRRNNFSRITMREPEGLIIKLDKITDQHQKISGFMYWNYQALNLRYWTITDNDPNTIQERVITQHTPVDDGPNTIVWREDRPIPEHRNFHINLAPGERILSQEAAALHDVSYRPMTAYIQGDAHHVPDFISYEFTVMKGVDYHATNFTLSMDALHEVNDVEADLHALLIERAHAAASDILTDADLRHEIRVIGGTLLDVLNNVGIDQIEDGGYSVILEIGNVAYPFVVHLDLSSYTDLLMIRLPIHMFFELGEKIDLDAFPNVNLTPLSDPFGLEFESRDYHIHNDSMIDVDVYLTDFTINDAQNVRVLNPGEVPLDFADDEPEPDDWPEDDVWIPGPPRYQDINEPLIDLFLVNGKTQLRLYERLEERLFMALEAGTSEAIGLEGSFFGPLPGLFWAQEYNDDGNPISGSGEWGRDEPLNPRYDILFRFVPRPSAGF